MKSHGAPDTTKGQPFCLSPEKFSQGIKWKWKLNRSWGQHYRGLSSDLYGMGTKRNQGDRLLRDRHLGPSQIMAPIWSEGPDKSAIGHDNGSQNFYVFD